MAHIKDYGKGAKGKRYEKRWSEVRMVDGKLRRKFYKRRFARKEDAAAYQRFQETRASQSLPVDPSLAKQLFSKIAEQWYDFKVLSIKPSTARQYRSILDDTVLDHF